MSRHVVAEIHELPPGSRKTFTVKGREIVVFNVGGKYSALLNKCPHEGAKLCFGVQTGLFESHDPGTYDYSRPKEFIRCPWHGWEFDVVTGKSYCDPESVWVRQYPVTVVEGERLVEGPFSVETFQVHLEDKYVVVEI